MKTTYTKLIKIHHLAAIALACTGLNADDFEDSYVLKDGQAVYVVQDDTISSSDLIAPSDNVQMPVEEMTSSQPLIQLDDRANRETFNSIKSAQQENLEIPSQNIQNLQLNPDVVNFNAPAALPPLPPTNPQPQVEQKSQVQTMVHGIHIINNPEHFNPNGRSGVDGVHYHDVDIPGSREDLTTHLQDNFCGKPIDETYVPRLKCAIQNHYADEGHPLVMVCVPPQNITCGCVQILVQEATLGEVRTEGNCWFSSRLLKSYIHICPGDTISEDELLNDVAWMNRNIFRFTQVTFTPGSQPGTTDIELVTVDRRPFRIYVGVDNAGSDQTSQTRLFTGFTAGNIWGLDHILGYQYTSSPDFHKFQSHTLNYQIPLTWQHMLMFYGGYANVHPHLRDFHSHGRSYQASTRYIVPIRPLYGDSLNEIKFGFDFKSTNNNLQFTDSAKTSIITGTVNLSQFMLGYNYGGSYGRHELLGSLQVYVSPGELFSNETKRDYQHLRYKAYPTYCYGQFTGGYNYDFSWGSEISFLVRTQYSTTNLLPSEQFVLGGYDTVRGYKEFEVLTDNGLIVNVELRTPAWSLLGDCATFCGHPIHDELRLLAFVDYGKGFNHKLFRDERRDYQLLSVGPGLRYKLANNLSVRLDWGIKLKKSSRLFGWGSKLHFGVIADY